MVWNVVGLDVYHLCRLRHFCVRFFALWYYNCCLKCRLIHILTIHFTALSSGAAGLAISCTMELTGIFQWGVRQSAEAETQMTSVERVIEYSQLPSEAPLESTKGTHINVSVIDIK